MVEVIAGPAPGKGTITRSRPNVSLNSSPERCGVDPVPGCAKLYLPGLALISATRSLTDWAGTCGLTHNTLGEAATSVTGVKSRNGSYGTLAYKLGLMMNPVLTTRIV